MVDVELVVQFPERFVLHDVVPAASPRNATRGVVLLLGAQRSFARRMTTPEPWLRANDSPICSRG
jgi:hypothetical protein